MLSCSRLESTGTPVAPTTGTLASLNGFVTDMVTRNPLPGVFVSIAGVGMTTGVDGRYGFSALRGGDALLMGRRQGLVNFSQTVSLRGARTIDIPMRPADVVRFAGNYAGTWRTGTIDRSGGLTASVVVNTVAETVQVQLDVNGNLVDDYDPPGDIFLGTLTSAGVVRLSGASSIYGTVSVEITPDGRITGSATRVPIGSASRCDFTGTMSATTTTVNYAITFDDGSEATGVATLSRLGAGG